MKMVKKNVAQLLHAYENLYQTQLGLSLNGEIIAGQKQSYEKQFFVLDDYGVLFSSEALNGTEFSSIMIALQQVLENYSPNQIFKRACFDDASFFELEQLKKGLKESEYQLFLVETLKPVENLELLIKGIADNLYCWTKNENGFVGLISPCDQNDQLFHSMKDTLEMELYCRVMISVGNVFTDFFSLPVKIKELYENLAIAKIYDPSLQVVKKKDVLIYKLIRNLNEKEKVEILNALIPGDFDLLDEELINTATVFMNNDLNLAAAAKDLFVHRNTLVYRLDKIASICGLDIRHLEEAVSFRLSSALKRCIDYERHKK